MSIESPLKIWERYAADGNLNEFFLSIAPYFAMPLMQESDDAKIDLSQYFEASLQGEALDGPLELWPAARAWEQMRTIDLMPLPVLETLGLRSRLPVLQIGRDPRSSQEIWMILKPVVYGQPAGRIVCVNPDFAFDRLSYFDSVNPGQGTASGDRLDAILELIHSWSRLSIVELLQAQKWMLEGNQNSLEQFLSARRVYGTDGFPDPAADQACIAYLEERN